MVSKVWFMHGFFNSFRPLIRFGFGLFVLALLGALAQAVHRWAEAVRLSALVLAAKRNPVTRQRGY